MMIKITNKNQIKMLQILREKNPILLSELNSKLGGFYQLRLIVTELIALDLINKNENNKINLCKNVSIKNYDKLGNLEVEINEWKYNK